MCVRLTGLKSPGVNVTEGSVVYGKVKVDREGVTLADPCRTGKRFQSLKKIGTFAMLDVSSYGP
jgi:hypothetical protein